MDRRDFVRLTGLAGAAAAAGLGPLAEAGAGADASEPGRRREPNEAWMERLTGEYRQVWDVVSVRRGSPLGSIRNFLNAYEFDYGVPLSKVNAVAGLHGRSVPLAFTDEAWSRYELGRLYEVVDPSTGDPATHNPYHRRDATKPLARDISIEALQERGVIFTLCNNSFRGLAARLAGAGHGTQEELLEVLRALLIPGVEVVPAMVATLNRLQQRGVTYVYSG